MVTKHAGLRGPPGKTPFFFLLFLFSFSHFVSVVYHFPTKVTKHEKGLGSPYHLFLSLFLSILCDVLSILCMCCKTPVVL